MDKELRDLGKILLTNIFVNSKGLNIYLEEAQNRQPQTQFASRPQGLFDLEHEMGQTKKRFSKGYSKETPDKYSPEALYPLMLLTKEPEKVVGVGRSKNYVKLQREFVSGKYASNRPLFESSLLRHVCQEAHNRVCQKCDVLPADILYTNFFKYYFSPDAPGVFNYAQDQIYLNAELNYLEKRPTLLLETVNMLSREHILFQNTLKMLKEPESMSDYEYFVSLTDAMSYYLGEQIKKDENLSKMFPEYSRWMVSFPSILERERFAYQETRENLQSAGVYGGKIRQDFRQREVMFYTALQNGAVFSSMVATENMQAVFEQSQLNVSSNGLMASIFSRIVNATAPAFFNELGATMLKGESVTEHLDLVQEYSEKSNENMFFNVLPKEGEVFEDKSENDALLNYFLNNLPKTDETTSNPNLDSNEQ